jgi:RNA polymerase sigma-70 factor, ECF subfamily
VNSPGIPGPAQDEARLLQRIARRDREAFNQLYDRYADSLYSTAMRVLNNPNEAGNVLQSVFVQIWDDSPAYDPAFGSPFHWALKLTRQRAIERLGALRRPYVFFAEIAGEKEEEAVPLASGKAFTMNQTASARAALAALPYEQRQAIEMAFLGGMPQDEIAAALGQPVDIIAERIRRGMLRMRDGVREHL